MIVYPYSVTEVPDDRTYAMFNIYDYVFMGLDAAELYNKMYIDVTLDYYYSQQG